MPEPPKQEPPQVRVFLEGAQVRVMTNLEPIPAFGLLEAAILVLGQKGLGAVAGGGSAPITGTFKGRKVDR